MSLSKCDSNFRSPPIMSPLSVSLVNLACQALTILIVDIFIMPPTLKKLGLSVCVHVRVCVCPCVLSKKKVRVLKFHKWIPHQIRVRMKFVIKIHVSPKQV